ncbi:MAG: DNA polymerase I [Trueperella sp.]|nr:DNA polymerase I [Trueperella sp.]
MSSLLLLDGHSLAFRAFYALSPEGFRTAQGQYTNAVTGFINTLLKLLQDYQPSHIAVAFDLPGGTFRTQEYPEYKGGRAPTPEEFKGQIGLIQEVLDALGISWLTVPDYEADDILATLATRGASADMQVYVASGDKDSYQLVNESVTVLYPMPRSTMLEMTPAVVTERCGVPPERYSDLAALVGEKADNLPGVPLVGPKTAAKWLTEYGDLENLLANVTEIGGKSGENLRSHLEQVRLNRQLNELVRDLDIVPDLEELRPKGVDTQQMHEIFDVLEINRLRKRVLDELPVRSGSSAIVEEVATRTAQNYDGEFADFLAETSAPYALLVAGSGKPGAGAVTDFAIAANSGVVWRGSDAGVAGLAEFLADPQISKVCHGMKASWHAWLAMGMELDGVEVDTLLQAYLLHPDQRSYEIDDLAQRYLSIDLSGGAEPDTLGIAADGTLADSLSPRAVALLDLAEIFKRELAEQGQTDDLVELELETSRVLYRMEQRGIYVDEGALESLYQDFDGKVQAAQRQAYAAIGDDSVNLSSPKQLQVVLFEKLGLPKTRKTKSGYTTNAEALEELLVKISHREDDAALAGQAFLTALLAHRDTIKLRQSVQGLQKSVQSDHRIRTTYTQTVAATGRLSSVDPNLQNIHARTEEGLQIREVFVPGVGFDYLMTADYSQIEMRLMAHLSGDAELISAFNAGADLHSYVAARVYHVPEDQVTAAQRSKIKAMSYGLVYGLSAFGLSKQLRIGVPEAQELMDGYFERFGNVKNYLDSLVVQARRDGYTQTILGRRRYLPELTATNRQLRQAAERMALNAPIQGSAADIIKIAMSAVEREMRKAKMKSQLLLQVHDELVLEVVAAEKDDVVQLVRAQMESAQNLSVPLSVGIGIGESWRAAAH